MKCLVAASGYVDVLLIPASATTITIREESGSNNHLGTYVRHSQLKHVVTACIHGDLSMSLINRILT